jgi:hypothetical protein
VTGDRVARPGYVAIWLEICRRSLAGIDEPPTELFPDDDDLADAIARHPAGGDAA